MKKILVLPILFLAGCGGGGDNAISYNYTQGAPSSESAANNVIFATTGNNALPYDDPNGNSYVSLVGANAQLNGAGNDPVATTDTGARNAWTEGWTGKGVKVGIADDYNSNGRWDTHGDWVSIVVASVAPEVDAANIDMLGAQKAMTADQALAWFEDNGYHIINASWGIEKYDPDTGQIETNFDSYLNTNIAAFDQDAENSKNALIVYASGNSGNFCPGKRAENCDLKAAEIDKLREAGKTAGEKTIFVGALQDATNTIAGYSIIGGDLMNDFIVSYDDILTSGDSAGTSFAAPRVTGAAALVRDKFPNLDASQLKQVLLQTATDLGAAGVDEVYGHGKLNIAGALSPQGTVVPK